MMPKAPQKPPFLLENIQIDDFAAEGKCLTRLDGEVVFVEGVAAPGDMADIRVFRRKKHFLEGQIVGLRQPSSVRVQPACEHFGVCGGCKWQHIDYQQQTAFKARQVRDALERIGKVRLPPIQPLLGAPETYFYRNKLEFSFSANRWLTDAEIRSGADFDRNAAGFHVPKRFDRILDIRKCWLQPEPSNAIRLALKEYAQREGLSFYDSIQQRGFLRSLTIRTASTGQVMVVVQVAQPDEAAIAGVMDFLQNRFPTISSLHYVLNQKGNDTFHDLDVVCRAGEPFIEEEMEGLRFRIGPKSFYQTNSAQAHALYRVAREFARLRGDELVYDLYTGTGTIANFVARQARRVVGLEFVEAAVEDARVNSRVNGVENTAFFAGDMRKLLTADFFAQHGRPDVVITDPPRAGMDAEVVQALLGAAPRRIVYVSCNPATQARDLALLDEAYAVTAVQPVDMFPHTHHVENVVALERRQ
jgi:23S rRNA (uracil1939-C5)-methyltransferase